MQRLILFFFLTLPGWHFAQHPIIEELVPVIPAAPDFGSSLEVEQFELLEIGVTMKTFLQHEVATFLSASDSIDPITRQPIYGHPNTIPGMNPYDPAQLDLFAEFTSPSGQIFPVNGFYYQSFQPQPDTTGWIALPTQHPWRIRFAPTETGNWTFRIGISLDSGARLWMNDRSFTCIPNQRNNPGFVEVSSSGYYLQFTQSGELFMPYGLNLGTDALLPNGMHIGPNYDIYPFLTERMDSLRQEGANLMRLRIAPIGFGFEWERLGNYHPRQYLSWELDRIVDYAQAHGVYILLTGVFEGMECKPSRVDWSAGNRHHPYSWYEDSLLWLDESSGNTGHYANRAYYGNPYNKYLFGQTSDSEYDLDPFWESDEVMHYAKNRVRYTVARWGWATAIADITVSSEFETFEKQALRDDAAEIWFEEVYPQWFPWLMELTDYLAELDHFHLVGNSQGTDVLQFQNADSSYSYFDIGDEFWEQRSNQIIHVNPYGSWPDRNHFFTSRVRKQRRHRKPIWWAETGLSYPCPDAGRLCILEDRVSFHNNLWAMSMSGAVPPCHFWGERIYAFKLVHLYRPLVEFFSGEDLHQRLYQPVIQHWHPRFIDWISSGEEREYVIVNDTNLLECFALRSVDDQRILGFLHNRTVNWANFPAFASDLKYEREGHYAHFDYDAPVPPEDYVPSYQPAHSPTVTISNLPKRHRYEFQLWSTVGDGGILEASQLETDRKGVLKIEFPSLTGALDSNGHYDPGAYAFKLNSLEASQPHLIQSFELSPNPGLEGFQLYLVLHEELGVEVSVFDSRGKLIRELSLGEVQRIEREVQMEDVAPGVYWVRARSGANSWTRKWVKLR